MKQYRRLILALALFLSGFALLPQTSLFAEAFNWMRFVGAYEDTITVTKARYRGDRNGGELDVDALSSAGGAAVLSVYRTSDNFYFGQLTYSGGIHTNRFTNVGPNPQVITVRSSLGGWSTVLVSLDSGPPVTVTPSITPTSAATVPPNGPKLYLPLVVR